jgi:hypothetical protein
MNLATVRRGVGLAIATGIVWCSFWLGGSAGEPVYKLHIESQPLEDALQEFAGQTDMQIIFFSHLTDGRRSVAVDGKYTLAVGLSLLLSESKLTYRLVNSKTIEILPARMPPRGAVR